jgi:uncharacterized surface protein with fasciclin (FAS1) repeats
MATVQKQPKTIVDLAADAGNFTTLLKAAEAADLVSTLSGEGPFTIFAPSDDAFEQLPKGTVRSLLKAKNQSKLQSILKNHVTEGRMMAADVAGRSSIDMLGGRSLPIQKDGNVVQIGDASIRQTNLEAQNGVVHVIDRVLVPEEE